MAHENSGWGYNRISGALKNLGHCVSDQTVGILLEARSDLTREKLERTRMLMDKHVTDALVTGYQDWM